MERLIECLKSTPQAIDNEEIFYPGEMEARAEARNREAGIALPDDTLADLDANAEDLGIEPLSSIQP